MKNTNICPKCQSTDILRIEGQYSHDDIGNNIKVGIFGQAIVHKYLCCECGYTEEWVNKDDIERIKKKHNK